MELLEGDHIKFDFLGKDSIKYENTVHVSNAVWQNMKAFKARTQDGDAKAGGEQLFDAMNAQVRPLAPARAATSRSAAPVP